MIRTKRVAVPLLLMAVAGLLAAGCATVPKAQPEPKNYRMTDDGKVVWLEEFEFARPPAGWKLMQVEDGDEFAFAFIKGDGCAFPCQSTFAYDEEPFGYSTDLEQRMDEFFRRFLWGTHMTFQRLKTTPVQVLGGDGLAALAEGTDPVIGHKVWSKVVLGKRGDRVVSFYLTQWRPIGAEYDPQAEVDFDAFAESFRFLKKSFYEAL
jgi:hypothetical protein